MVGRRNTISTVRGKHIVLILCCSYCTASNNLTATYYHEQRLIDRLFRDVQTGGYNKWIRPVKEREQVLDVYFKLIVRQLLDVDEKNQLMNTNVWLKQSWNDGNLRWDPNEFGNIKAIRVPSELIWLPDIVLLGNADGNFSVSHMTRALLHSNGNVTWKPPATFKSWCNIDVTYFPFDVQNCSMRFASWTYPSTQVRLKSMEKKVDVTKLLGNGEWTIIDTTISHINENTNRENTNIVEVMFDHQGLCYRFIMKRLPLFYTVFLITPCLGISFLTGLVFYLPSDSQEKITLCISVLLAHTFYLLVITEIIPSTSNAIPLIGEYLLFTMIFITLSIIVTTICLNVHYRTNTTHRPLPGCLRYLLLNVSPKFLCLETFAGEFQWNQPLIHLRANILNERFRNCDDLIKSSTLLGKPHNAIILNCIRYLVRRIKKKIQQKREAEEWKYAAMVLDRILLCIFLAVSFIATIVLFLPAFIG